jgi:hypothetical protein
MSDNPYTVELLESRFKESNSLVEHILIACDFYEYHVNLILAGEKGNQAILNDLNISPEQKFMYAMGIMRNFDEEDENGVCYFWGIVKSFYDLRKELHKLDAVALDKKVHELCNIAANSPYRDIINSFDTMKLWDRDNLAIATYVEGYTSVYLKKADPAFRYTANDFLENKNSNSNN